MILSKAERNHSNCGSLQKCQTSLLGSSFRKGPLTYFSSYLCATRPISSNKNMFWSLAPLIFKKRVTPSWSPSIGFTPKKHVAPANNGTSPRPLTRLFQEISKGFRFGQAQLLQSTSKQKLHVVFTLLSWKKSTTTWWFFATHLKNMRKSNWIISPGIGLKNKHYSPEV